MRFCNPYEDRIHVLSDPVFVLNFFLKFLYFFLNAICIHFMISICKNSECRVFGFFVMLKFLTWKNVMLKNPVFFYMIKKTAWFLRRFFMVFFNSNAVFTTFERWMNFRCGVGAGIVRRSFHNQIFFPTIHGWHLVSKSLRCCRHV